MKRKSFFNKMPNIKNLYQQIKKQGIFPAGHYYSPIPDRNEVLAYIQSRKPLRPDLPDVELNKDNQFRLLNEYIKFYEELPFPEKQNRNIDTTTIITGTLILMQFFYIVF